MSKKLLIVLLIMFGLLISHSVLAESQYTQSPMLDQEVIDNNLPSVENRIPKDPFVVGPGTLVDKEYLDWQVGQHGGTLRLAAVDGVSHEMFLALGTTILRSPGQSTEDPEPALVSSYSVSDNNQTFEFTIREDLKWSDGEMVTTEDVRFLFEDIYLNDEVPALLPDMLRTQGNPNKDPMQLEIIDEKTFIITFDEPYGWFITELASWIQDYTKLFQPSHYLKNFHADYTPEEEIKPLAEEAGFDEWYELLDQKVFPHWDLIQSFSLGVPVLTPWVPVRIDSEILEYERNPYFWKVDIEGNQLPYIDKIRVTSVSEHETLNMRVIAGEVDLLTQTATLNNMPLFRANEERGDYETIITGSINAPHALFLNHDYEYEEEESVWQDIIRDEDRRFAQALAYAIDSADVNQSIYFGMYDIPTMNTSEFDPDKAEKLLDEMGMSEFDSDGYRLGPDGEEFEFVITPSPEMPDLTVMAELYKEYFENIGIRTAIDQMGLDIFFQRKDNNQLQASLYWNDRPIWSSGISIDYMPNFKGAWAPASQEYYFQDGDSGRKPPEYLQEFFDLHDTRKEYPAESERGQELYQELENWFSDNLVMIYGLENVQTPNIVSNRLKNVPREGYPYDMDIPHSMNQMFLVD